jgi:hypothetical protein
VELLKPAPETASLLAGPERMVFQSYGAPMAGLAANR